MRSWGALNSPASNPRGNDQPVPCGRVTFRRTHGVGAPILPFAARWRTDTLPYRRFAPSLRSYVDIILDYGITERVRRSGVAYCVDRTPRDSAVALDRLLPVA